MARLILAIIAFAMAMMVIKMLLVAIVLAGLIFRTKQTIVLLVAGGMMTLLIAQPLIGVGLLALMGVSAFVKHGRSAQQAAIEDLSVKDDGG